MTCFRSTRLDARGSAHISTPATWAAGSAHGKLKPGIDVHRTNGGDFIAVPTNTPFTDMAEEPSGC